MRLTGSRAYTRPAPVPKMPTGLIELMEDLTRDVLKNNPPDVYEFCADHMRKLLDIRDGPSLKRTLTLEEKIACAQEKVKKRGEARWQRYVTEKKKPFSKKDQSDLENILSLEETKVKSPVYPNLKENTSEIEIAHEPEHANDVPVEPNIITDITDEDGNKALTQDTKKDVKPDNISKSLDSSNVGTDTSDFVQQTNNSVTKINNIKVDTKNLQDSFSIENAVLNSTTVKDTTIDAINLKGDVNEKVDGTTYSTHKTSPTDEVIVRKSEQKDGYQANNSLTDMGTVVITTMSTVDIINESPRSQKSETVQDVNDDNNHNKLQTQDKTSFEKDVSDMKENIDSKILLKGETDKKIEKKDEQANISIADMGNVINTTLGILSTINENSRSHSQKAAAIEGTDDDNNLDLLQSQDKNNFHSDVDEVKEKMDSKLISTQKTASTHKEILKNSELEIDIQANNSLANMGKVVNTAIGIVNVINDTPSSPIHRVETLEDMNDNSNHDLPKITRQKDKKSFPTHVERTDLSTETVMPEVDDIIKDDRNMGLQNEHTECAMTDYSLNAVKNVDENTRNHDNMRDHLVEKDLKDENMIMNESDNIKLTYETKTSECSPNVFEPINDHEIDEHLETDKATVASGVTNDYELYNQSFGNFKNDDTSLVQDSVGVLGPEEPLVNAVIIEASNVQEEPTEGNIIEIRISQVAEVLNNEVPLTVNNIKVPEESDSPFNSSLDTDKNEAGIHIEDSNEIQTQSTTEDIDCESNKTSGNFDDVYNVNITSGLKSTSIDESTDGMDNTSLIESGTSDITDDVFLNNANNSNMDLETAAVTIQKVFRSFMFKSRASTFEDNDENISMDEDNDKKDESEFQNTNINKERRGINRMDTVLQTVNEEKSLSLSTDDSSTLSSAATTIQAHVRGFLVRNRLNSHKTASTNSQVNSDGHDDVDIDHKNNKTILNIHIVPEGGNYLSRDESMLTSMDFSLDGSPPSSLNLHPLGYDKNERRKQLKREDAIQSISPPSNNSGKLSEDVDSVKDMIIEGVPQTDKKLDKDDITKNGNVNNRPGSADTSPTNSLTIETVIEAHKLVDQDSSDADTEVAVQNGKGTLTKQTSDEMDVVTPFEDKHSLADSSSSSKLMHSGEFHDVVLPTKVSRGDASVVSEFKNVLVYFLLWNNS